MRTDSISLSNSLHRRASRATKRAQAPAGRFCSRAITLVRMHAIRGGSHDRALSRISTLVSRLTLLARVGRPGHDRTIYQVRNDTSNYSTLNDSYAVYNEFETAVSQARRHVPLGASEALSEPLLNSPSFDSSSCFSPRGFLFSFVFQSFFRKSSQSSRNLDEEWKAVFRESVSISRCKNASHAVIWTTHPLGSI